ncbi:MAG: Uma2 family endonuclease [Rhodothermales bacterium]
MSTHPQTYLTPEEYLAFEHEAEVKHEYYAGEIFAFAGASRQHNLIVGNVYAGLHAQLRQRPCEVYASDMRVRVSPTGLYTYPDVVAVCEEARLSDEENDTLLNPTVIVEVLSASTAAYDRGEKFEHYRKLESLKEYLVIAQERHHVERHVRQSEGQWLLSETDSVEDVIELPSIACRLAVADIYEKVEFET